jgi:hypothetical protein
MPHVFQNVDNTTMPVPNIKPIVVLVKDGRYDAYGLYPEATERDRWLMSLLKAAGGINEQVEEGVYYFNAQKLGPNSIKMDLIKFPDPE